MITPNGAVAKMQTGSSFIKMYLNQFSEKRDWNNESFDRALKEKRAMDQALRTVEPYLLNWMGWQEPPG